MKGTQNISKRLEINPATESVRNESANKEYKT
jgi:hypothetical protein